MTNRSACLVHIYPTGPGMGTRYPLGDNPVVLGRGSDCEIRINDHSVSRKHARIQPGIEGYYAVDLQSTNGTFVNDVPASMYKLKDGDYLRVGNCIYRFLMGGNVENEYHEEIYRLTIIDALTDIHNKRYFLEFLDRELARSGRYGRPLSLIMIDIDHFKNVNEELGHLGGDYHPARTRRPASRGRSARKSCSPATAARSLPSCCPKPPAKGPSVSAIGCCTWSARIRSCTRSTAMPSPSAPASPPRSARMPTLPVDLIRQADENLYQAKREGRNRVCG